MSLFGALTSGVSGLTAQSSAMGAISDNITNVSTIGYKNTRVDFQTLVTAQTSATLYSAGGVQSSPRQDTGVQGLLKSTDSQTDLSLSGSGFFVVNGAAEPSVANEFLFTRSGSFFQDADGFLRNNAGFYLQAWPTDALGEVIPALDSLNVANQNVISTDYLESVNLNRVGGTATATSQLSIGANLPSNDAAGTTHRTDVQFFDTLGNANSMSIQYIKSTVDNQWDVALEPPSGTATVKLETSATSGEKVYKAVGQLQFTARPAEGSKVVVDGISYVVDSDASLVESNGATSTKRWNTNGNLTIAQDIADLVAAISASDSDFTTTFGRVKVSPASNQTILFEDDGTDSITVDPIGLLDTLGASVVRQQKSFQVAKRDDSFSEYRQLHFPRNPSTGERITVNSIVYEFTTSADTSLAPVIEVAINGTGGSTTAAEIAATLANFEAALEANDPEFAGDAIRLRASNQDKNLGAGAFTNDTVVFKSKANGSDYTIDESLLVANSNSNTQNVLKSPAAITAAVTVGTDHAIIFDSDGIPNAFNVAEIEITDFENGAANMDDVAVTGSPQITLDFGTVGQANGLTQFGSSFTPVFTTQNGSQFGTFSAVTVTTAGLLTALFSNGESRPVFQIPVATFVNVNSLGARTGNVWNSTELSGDPTLREADSGLSGQIIQATLEQSTVDIGTEFTKMIIVQRAFSASAKILSTADEMLEELLRTKR